MKFSFKQAYEASRCYLKSGVIPYLIGDPGTGKSTLARMLASDFEADHLDWRLSQMDALDLRGVPYVHEGRTLTAVPGMFPDGERKSLIMLDELAQANLDAQCASFQLLLDRQLGDYRLPDNAMIMAASNRVSNKAGARPIPTALLDRMAVIDFCPTLDDWADWANGAGIDPRIVFMLRWKSAENPALLNAFMDAKFDPRSIKDGGTFPTQRSWASASKFVDAPDSIRPRLIAGCVGDTAAMELEAVLPIWDKCPTFSAIMADPKGIAVPNDLGATYAVATMVARTVDAASFDKAMLFIGRLPKEFETMAVVDAARLDAKRQAKAKRDGTRVPSLCDTQAFTDWVLANSNVKI